VDAAVRDHNIVGSGCERRLVVCEDPLWSPDGC
jgi:hypothetical protein